ncbi:MAG: hypothetical protein AAGE52_27990 [Myxococcota bacterium]
MNDPLARRLAAAALATSLVAVVLAGYAVIQGQQYLEDVRVLGQTLESAQQPTESTLGPPPQLDVD